MNIYATNISCTGHCWLTEVLWSHWYYICITLWTMIQQLMAGTCEAYSKSRKTWQWKIIESITSRSSEATPHSLYANAVSNTRYLSGIGASHRFTLKLIISTFHNFRQGTYRFFSLFAMTSSEFTVDLMTDKQCVRTIISALTFRKWVGRSLRIT